MIHGLAHPGIRATRHLIASHYLWPGLAKGCCSLVQRLPGLPELKATSLRSPADSRTCSPLYPHACGPGQASVCVGRGVINIYSRPLRDPRSGRCRCQGGWHCQHHLSDLERFHRRLKDALHARVATTDWPQHFPWVLFGLRVATRKDSGVL
jgi:hypothetical protein